MRLLSGLRVTYAPKMPRALRVLMGVSMSMKCLGFFKMGDLLLSNPIFFFQTGVICVVKVSYFLLLIFTFLDSEMRVCISVWYFERYRGREFVSSVS